MSKELKQYKLNGLRFVHDSRGRFVRDGEIAWLDDDKAQKIKGALKRDGRPDALTALDKKPKKSKKVVEPVMVNEDSIASEGGEEVAPFSVVGSLEAALALHFSERKALASKIIGEPVESTPQADSIIRDAGEDVLMSLLEGAESGD